ncbi:MAG: FtsX-like permease family protein, partial [Acidimicrobiia bacterium]|nr:FtsX-like permease family protein [Acidimicrobiia bacterium]
VAAELNATFLASGADAESFRSLVEVNLAGQTQFFRLMQGYLAIGLLVGIAGLGVVMVRAVRERRRQVGVLRALGYPSAAVRRAFLVESAFVAAEGIVIGTVLALVTAWQIVGNDTFGDDLPFAVPWFEVAVLVVVTLAMSLLATAAPAQQASRIKPAVALRLAD